MNYILEAIDAHLETIDKLKIYTNEIKEVALKIIERLNSGGKVIIMGNGGSAADSQHFAAELVGRFKKERKGLPAIALSTDTSILTSIGNDYSYDYIFARQVEAIASTLDIVIGISTSGDSKNIINAINVAKGIGAYTIGFLGKDGGILKNMVDFPIIIPSNDTPRIQECHVLIYHIICGIIDEEFTK